MPDNQNFCARCGRLNTCNRTCYYETDFNGYHIPTYYDGYDSDSSDEELTYLEELIEYCLNIKNGVIT
jgi:hypothetical protein